MENLTAANLNERLSEALDFNEDDLMANRLGYLSSRQQEQLKSTFENMDTTMGKAVLKYMVGLAIGLAAIVVYFVVRVCLRGGCGSFEWVRTLITSSMLPVYAAGVAIAALSMFYTVFRSRRINVEKLAVKRHSGKVSLTVIRRRAFDTVVARQIRIGGLLGGRIGGTSIYVQQKEFDAFRNGQAYHIYTYQPLGRFLQPWPTILSAEVMI